MAFQGNKNRREADNVIVGKLVHKKLDKAAFPIGCLGYIDDLTDAEVSGMQVDGPTGLVFDTRENYLNHTSPLTGFKPTEIEHHDVITDGKASKIANAALKRGADKKVKA